MKRKARTEPREAAAGRPFDGLPDARDGLTRKERVVLVCLAELQAERAGRSVPTAMLYGRVLDHVDLSVAELQEILGRL
ncbi:MAG: hypothetical protein ACK4N5_23450, partial [Myxococcales bacterium]